MTVSELIDLLREQERDGHGDASIVADGLAVVDFTYDDEPVSYGGTD